jgi:hypothetical protein
MTFTLFRININRRNSPNYLLVRTRKKRVPQSNTLAP